MTEDELPCPGFGDRQNWRNRLGIDEDREVEELTEEVEAATIDEDELIAELEGESP